MGIYFISNGLTKLLRKAHDEYNEQGKSDYLRWKFERSLMRKTPKRKKEENLIMKWRNYWR